MSPGIAWGADLRPSLNGSTEYDSNVFRSPTDEKNDVVFRLTPRVALVEDREKFNYSVGYAMPWEIGVKYKDVRDLNQLADATFSYRATPQTELFGSDSFYYVNGLFRQDDNLQDPTLGGVNNGKERFLSNVVNLGAKHYFTSRLSGTLRVNQSVFDTNQFNRANALSFGGVASSGYQLTEHHQVGGGFSFTRQSFDKSFNRPSSDTDYYNLFGTWQWLFDETTSFDIQVGPALIHSSQGAPPTTVNLQTIPFTKNGDGTLLVSDFSNPSACPTMNGNTLLFDNAGNTCPQLLVTSPAEISILTSTAPGFNPEIPVSYLSAFAPQSVSDTRITYFANASLSKRWTPTVISSLSYLRQDDTASGIDGGATIDDVTLTTSWRLSERWDLSARTDWTQRKSATNGSRVFVVPGPSSVLGIPSFYATAANVVQLDSNDSLNTQRWGTAVRLAYRLTKNTVTALQYAYNKQSSSGDTVGQTSDFDDHLVTFSVQYNFEPIGLWW